MGKGLWGRGVASFWTGLSGWGFGAFIEGAFGSF